MAVLVVGAGPAGLAAAEVIASAGVPVRVVERMPSVGRKLLMAGRGGLNLTHAEPLDCVLSRYGDAAGWLAPLIEAFPPAALRAWCAELGIATFVGSSGRVFPVGLKASPLLRAWLRRLAGLGVSISTGQRWTGFASDGRALIDGVAQPERVVVLACGGASWPRLGSDGGWQAWLPHRPLVASNAGIDVAWSPVLAALAGQPIKPLALSIGPLTARGEAVVTANGLEGGAVYAVGAAIRSALAAGPASITLDLLPDLTAAAIASRWRASAPRDSTTNRLRKAVGLTGVRAALAREAGPLPMEAEAVARHLKALPLTVIGMRPLERAISSAGGVPQSALTADLMLSDRPGVFCCGEMLDWDAPTGGYLLTACWATGRHAGKAAVAWLAAAGG
ncbi:MAG: TIGR03862 family flavoprotein [Alphaproteobacteria bacterium]|nr:TIGR03862 family flavoprotein [Alphaproteobacteria bacterium]